MEFKDLKPGDKIVIVENRTWGMNDMGLMDKWLGQTVTVKEIGNGTSVTGLSIVEDQQDRGGRAYGWSWQKQMVDWEKTRELSGTTGGEY